MSELKLGDQVGMEQGLGLGFYQVGRSCVGFWSQGYCSGFAQGLLHWQSRLDSMMYDEVPLRLCLKGLEESSEVFLGCGRKDVVGKL